MLETIEPMILLTLWIAVSVVFAAFWALAGKLLSLPPAPDRRGRRRARELGLEEQAA